MFAAWLNALSPHGFSCCIRESHSIRWCCCNKYSLGDTVSRDKGAMDGRRKSYGACGCVWVRGKVETPCETGYNPHGNGKIILESTNATCEDGRHTAVGRQMAAAGIFLLNRPVTCSHWNETLCSRLNTDTRICRMMHYIRHGSRRFCPDELQMKKAKRLKQFKISTLAIMFSTDVLIATNSNFVTVPTNGYRRLLTKNHGRWLSPFDKKIFAVLTCRHFGCRRSD